MTKMFLLIGGKDSSSQAKWRCCVKQLESFAQLFVFVNVHSQNRSKDFLKRGKNQFRTHNIQIYDTNTHIDE